MSWRSSCAVEAAKSKRGGAWCGSFRSSFRNRSGKRVIPLVTNVSNFTPPGKGRPALLSLNEVRTLFHEFGHALHVLLSDVTYPGSATRVKVDFVELPSQIMENWATEPAVLKLYARHHKTGKTIQADTDIAAELDLDSLAVMDVIMELEDSMDISIPLNLIPDIKTVGDLAGTIGQLKEET